MFYKVSVSFHKDFIKIRGNVIEIGITTKPVKGEANLEIVKKISRHFGIPRTSVRIVSGEKSRDKIIQIDDPPNPKK